MKFNVKELSKAILVFLYAVAFIGQMYPYGFPLFPFLLTLLLGLTATRVKSLKMTTSIVLLPLILMFFIFSLAMLVDIGSVNEKIIKDFSNIILLTLLFLLTYNLLKTRDEVEQFFSRLKILVYCSVVIVSVIGLYKFSMLLSGHYIEKFFIGDVYPIGTSLVGDYNFFSLTIFCGLLISLNYLDNSKSIFHTLLHTSSLLLFSTCIALSGSRRGLLVLLFGGLIYFIAKQSRLLIFMYRSVQLRFNKHVLISCIIYFFIILVSFKYVNLERFNMNDEGLYQFDRIISRAESLLAFDGDSGNGIEAASTRIVRLEQSIDYLESYNALELLIGKGFGYIHYLGKLNETRSGYDYPHNVLISTLLSSGVIGVFIVLSYISVVYICFNRCRKEAFPFLIYFFISTFYLLSSGDQLIANKVYVIVSFLPLIYYLRRNVNESRKGCALDNSSL